MDIGSNNFATDHYQYDPSFAYGPSDYDVTHAFKVFGVWSPTFFKDSDSWAETAARQLDHQRHPERPFRLSMDTRVQQHRLRRRVRGERLERRRVELRAASGGLPRWRRERLQQRRVQADRRQFPERGRRVLHGAGTHTRARRLPTSSAGCAAPGPIPQAPGVERNSFRGPRYFNVDATLNKGFGLPAIKGLGTAPRLEIRAGFYNLFNQINLKNIQADILNEHFGEAQEGLAGRVDRAAGQVQFLIGGRAQRRRLALARCDPAAWRPRRGRDAVL